MDVRLPSSVTFARLILSIVSCSTPLSAPSVRSSFAKSLCSDFLLVAYIVTLILWRNLRLPRTPFQGSTIRGTLRKLDLTGMAMLVSTLTFLVVALNLGGQELPWKSPTIIGLFCAAGGSFISFVVAENYAKEPVAPIKLFVCWRWRLKR